MHVIFVNYDCVISVLQPNRVIVITDLSDKESETRVRLDTERETER